MFCFFFFQAEDGIRDVAVTGVQTCALPISHGEAGSWLVKSAATISSAISMFPLFHISSHQRFTTPSLSSGIALPPAHTDVSDRKSTRLNSSHGYISYAVFCLKKKTTS